MTNHLKPGRQGAATLGLSLGLLLMAPSPAFAQMQMGSIDARLSRLERMMNEGSLSDLVLQIQRLQQEVQDLRGQMERQQYLLRQKGIVGPGSGSTPGASSGFSPGPSTGPGSGPTLDLDPFAGPGRVSHELPGTGGDPFDSAQPSAAADDNQQAPAQDVAGQSASSSGLLGLPAPETSAGGERDLYREAFELLKARDYPGARGAFGEMIKAYPQGQFADNGRYWLGEIGYVTQDYAAAQAQFNRLVTDYPQSSKVPSAMLKLGYVYYEQDQLADAKETLEEVVRRFPDSTEAELARGRLQRMEREGQQ